MKTQTTREFEAELGSQLRALRLRKNVHQIDLAKQAGLSLGALKNIELGKGATLRTFIKVLRALDRLDWIGTIAPTVSISPLQMIKTKKPVRQRASPKR